MIHVAHEGHDGRAQLQFVLFRLLRLLRRLDHDLHLVDAAALLAFVFLENEAVLLAERARDIRLHGLVDVREDIHLHQILHDLRRTQAQLGGQILDDDGRLDVNDLLVAQRLRFLGQRLLLRQRLGEDRDGAAARSRGRLGRRRAAGPRCPVMGLSRIPVPVCAFFSASVGRVRTGFTFSSMSDTTSGLGAFSAGASGGSSAPAS